MSLVLGWLVGLVDVAQFLPQTRRTLRMRHDRTALAGLSVWTWSIATAQALAWIVYGVADSLWAIALPNLIIAPACAAILIATVRARRSGELQRGQAGGVVGAGGDR